MSGRAGGKRRGAPPGNLNALRHGFYARAFDEGERADLDEAAGMGLDAEIAALRVAARRVLERLDGDKSSFEAIALLNSLGAAELKVASLLKTKKYLTGEGAGLDGALEQALTEVARELSVGQMVMGVVDT